MKASIFCIAVAMLCSGCSKVPEDINGQGLSPNTNASQFLKYTIHQGNQYCDQTGYAVVETSEMKFVVKFDSTAIYETKIAENQYDINKLFGFSDNNKDHHQYSARFGWRWSNHALRLFAYVYNEGVVMSKELTTIAIGTEANCSIGITENKYVFTVNDVTEQLPRMAATEKARGYQLYPYFGGDEAAPHEINIWIKQE